MAQHDFNLANNPGATFRADLNDALNAIATKQSGATAPSPTFSYQWWLDTSTNTLKVRDGANTTWVSVATLVGSVWTPILIDNQIGLAQLFHATQGDLLYWGSGGVPANLAASATVDFFLQSKGAGADPVWSALPSLGLQSVQAFTANGTWNKVAGTRLIKVTCVGGGGGGGSGDDAGTSLHGGSGGGGGSGGIAIEYIDATSLTSETVTRGGGGAGATGGSGNTGGTSSFGAFCSGNGGGGGGGATGVASGNAGAGGGASGGDINISGAQGAGGSGGNNTGNPGSNRGGVGGMSGFGNRGQGGKGADSTPTGPSTGSSGQAGIVIVEEYA